jgi:hypothetical protein
MSKLTILISWGSNVNCRSVTLSPIFAIHKFPFRVNTSENGLSVYGGKVGVREGSGEKVIVGIGSSVFVGEDKDEEG